MNKTTGIDMEGVIYGTRACGSVEAGGFPRDRTKKDRDIIKHDDARDPPSDLLRGHAYSSLSSSVAVLSAAGEGKDFRLHLCSFSFLLQFLHSFQKDRACSSSFTYYMPFLRIGEGENYIFLFS